MIQTLSAYYRLPDSFLNATMEGALMPAKGFFAFGAETTCFGRTSLPSLVHKEPSELRDVLGHCSYSHSLYHFPFDIDETVNNLRLERYLDISATPPSKTRLTHLLRTVYYLMRPMLPVHYRKHLQRFALRDWQQHTFPRWPVDVSIETIFANTLRLALSSGEVDRIPFIWFWPDGHTSCAIMTHDVETAVGRDFCNTLMNIEAQFEITSSFEIIPEVRYEVSQEFLDSIRSRGHEICIHGLNHDGHLFDSKEIFLERVVRINEYGERFGALGFRSPVMYRNVDWYDRFTFKYDMSIPNVGHLDPQRGGCCTVMPYFIENVLELPLTTIQDYPLYHILKKDTLDLWKEQAATIMSRNGLISFIIHPDYTVAEKEQTLYASLLEYLSMLRAQRNVWIALPRDVYHWWSLRNKMRIAERNGKVEIMGEGRQRARIAYALLDGDTVVYEIDR